jgi:hypothetical protein
MLEVERPRSIEADYLRTLLAGPESSDRVITGPLVIIDIILRSNRLGLAADDVTYTNKMYVRYGCKN